jgi:PiT family inorganic phosphate transporter
VEGQPAFWVVATRVLSPYQAVLLAALFNFVALVGAISWNEITWWYGIPSSSSHALIGGLVGAAQNASALRLGVAGNIVWA